MIEPDRPTSGPRWPFYVYRRLGLWAYRIHNRVLGRVRLRLWLWQVVQWSFRQRDPRRWEYEREQSAILILASLLVSLALWWLVGMP